MWTIEKTALEIDVTHYKILAQGKPLNVQEAIDLLRKTKEFRKFFNELLIASSYAAYFWEVKPTNTNRFQEEFEFVLVNSPALAQIKPDSSPFIDYFEGHLQVTSFSNLSGESRLIVPVQVADASTYSHLAMFVRNASEEQIDSFWKQVGEEFVATVGTTTRWLSTSGLGVHWLHVRIDERPKYYHYRPYKGI